MPKRKLTVPAQAGAHQKALDHRGIEVSDPIGALSRLQLARALAMSGDKIKSKTAYENFLTLCKDADGDHSAIDEGEI